MAKRSKHIHVHGEGSEEPLADRHVAEAGEHGTEAADPGTSEHEAGAPHPDETELDVALRERNEYLAHWQRSQADYQNLRRRMQQDLDAGARRAKQPILLEILIVLDQLEMALAIPAETEDARNLRYGVELTRDQLLRALEADGVTPIPEGGEFDPAVHQAMATVETDEAEPGTIVATHRKGWRAGDQVLRFAQVQVAAAPGAGAASEDA